MVKTVDWREVLRTNTKKTYIVMFLFIVIYILVGLVIDLFLNSRAYSNYPLSTIFLGLVTLKIIPWGAIIFSSFAFISIMVTLIFHNQIMLLGTNYKKITLDGKNSLLEKQIYNVVEEMKISAGMQYMPKIYIINANYMNAFASGFKEKNAMIAITNGLAEKLSRDELQAVLAHELSHIKHGDIKLTIIASILSNLMLMVIDILFWSVIFGGGSKDNDDDGDNKGNQLAMIVMLLKFVLPLITALLMLFLSRTREYMADSGAVELMRTNEPMSTALLKISQDHGSNKEAYASSYQSKKGEYLRQQSYIFDPQEVGIRPSQSISELFSTHPSIGNRLKSLGYKNR